MKEISTLLALVAAGSALGGMARFFVSGLVARAIGETFPWGTLVVNVTGRSRSAFSPISPTTIISRTGRRPGRLP